MPSTLQDPNHEFSHLDKIVFGCCRKKLPTVMKGLFVTSQALNNVEAVLEEALEIASYIDMEDCPRSTRPTIEVRNLCLGLV